MKRLLLLIVVAGIAALPSVAQEKKPPLQNGLRGEAPLNTEPRPAQMPKMVNDDQRRARAYPMQPPVIPHQVENYQVDRQFNKCMSCHGRDRVQESQAPMVSVTHYVDREGRDRAEISPRRYFCTQCHVPQMEVKPPVQNLFKDVSSLPPGQKK